MRVAVPLFTVGLPPILLAIPQAGGCTSYATAAWRIVFKYIAQKRGRFSPRLIIFSRREVQVCIHDLYLGIFISYSANLWICIGAITSVLTNPIWVIKTRMLSTGSRAPGAYSSFTSGARQIYHAEGIPGFYRGLVPALFGVSHGALQFMAYEQLKIFRSQSMKSSGFLDQGHTGAEQALGNVDFFAISSLSKVFAGSVTYPYQVIRSRLQTYEAHLLYRGAKDVFSQIWAQEGVAGFYKGLGPNLFRVLPSTWMTFLVYENTKLYLSRLVQIT